MTSDLLREYLTHRDQGHSHGAALNALSRRFDLDRDTIARMISRAQGEDRTQRKETNAA